MVESPNLVFYLTTRIVRERGAPESAMASADPKDGAQQKRGMRFVLIDERGNANGRLFGHEDTMFSSPSLSSDSSTPLHFLVDRVVRPSVMAPRNGRGSWLPRSAISDRGVPRTPKRVVRLAWRRGNS